MTRRERKIEAMIEAKKRLTPVFARAPRPRTIRREAFREEAKRIMRAAR